jgi:hypothetical protein
MLSKKLPKEEKFIGSDFSEACFLGGFLIQIQSKIN